MVQQLKQLNKNLRDLRENVISVFSKTKINNISLEFIQPTLRNQSTYKLILFTVLKRKINFIVGLVQINCR